MLRETYAQVEPVLGDLNSSIVIEHEATKADMVFHFASCDDVSSARAISRGLARTELKKPVYWFHTSGAMIMTSESLQGRKFGTELSKVYNDWDGVQELVSLPDSAPHRHVDKIVLDSASDQVKVAIVCPPTVYGSTRGIGNPRSMQINEIVRVFLTNGFAFQVNEGQNVWHQVHVQDLADLYLLFAQDAISEDPRATYNEQGYYLSENGSFYWGDICKEAAKIACASGLIQEADVRSLSPGMTARIWPRYNSFLGTTSKGLSIRANRLLGWTPHRPDIFTTLPYIVNQEASVLLARLAM